MGTDISVEHIVPVSLGGGNGIGNKALAHKLCNSIRSTNIDAEPDPSPLFEFVRVALLAARRRLKTVSHFQAPAAAKEHHESTT